MSKNLNIQTIAFNFIENKNNQTFTELINRLKPGLLSFVYHFVKDRDLSKEIVDQTFHTIWEKIDQYKPEFNFSTWAYAITKNEALGVLRNKNKHLSHDKLSENHSKVLQTYSPVFYMNTECIGPSGEELTQQLYDASLAAIYQLNEPYKTVMIEREINQKQLNEIADCLLWNLSTVKTRLRKARKDVAEVLYKKYPDLVDSYFGNNDYDY
jgi:RNA polymerase sigma-70 factor (ECF subfamily)